MVIRILIYYYSLLILLSENVPIKQICPEDIYIMIKFGKLKYLFFIFLIFCSSCANIYREEIKREPEKKDVYRKPADEKIYRNSVIVKATEQEAWDATLYSIGWIKWKIFKEDYQNGTITLKEAYVYDDNNSFKRIYHWPPKEKALLSNMTDYLNKVTVKNSRTDFKQIIFTQENMKFTLSRSGKNRIKITVDYQIFPYSRSFKLGEQLNSNNYIESIIFNKILEYLNSIGSSGQA